MGAAIRLILVGASKLTLVFVYVVDADLISVWGIELEFNSAKGPELIWFVSGGRK